MIEIVSEGLIPFIVVTKRDGTYNSWMPPNYNLFTKVVNRLTNRLLSQKHHVAMVVRTIKKWEGYGVVDLRSTSHQDLHHWRVLLTKEVIDGNIFNSFPQCRLDQVGQMTMVMKHSLSELDLEQIPATLFGWNPALEGGIEVICSRKYGPHDRTKSGESKNNWRLVWINGNQAFMESLKLYPVNHLFTLSSDLLLIRGGEGRRVPDPLVTRFKIDRTRPPPPFSRRFPQPGRSDALLDWEDEQ